MTVTVDELRNLAVEIARGAGEILLAATAGGVVAKTSPTDIVTDADRASELYIVDRIKSARPDDSILSEEGTLFEGTSGVSWVVDPLDGTVNYFYGIPQWCVSIGIEGAVRAGVVYDPKRPELFTDGDAMRPSEVTELKSALIGTGFSYSSDERLVQARRLERVLPNVRDIRRAGSCALDLAWVACGKLDGFYEHHTSHWDVSAGIAIIEAAGAHVRRRGEITIAAGTAELLEALETMVLED